MKSDTTKQLIEEKNSQQKEMERIWNEQRSDSKEGLHTQWEVEYCLDQSIFIMEGDKPIAMIQSEEDEGITPEMEANAELIVKAVNERKALLDALERALDTNNSCLQSIDAMVKDATLDGMKMVLQDSNKKIKKVLNNAN